MGTDNRIREVHYYMCNVCKHMFPIEERELADTHVCTGAYVWLKR